MSALLRAPVDLVAYRDESKRLRQQLADVEAQRSQLLRAIQANETLVATAIAPQQPLLPIDGLVRGRRATTRHGRALGAKLNRRDRRVLRLIEKGPISFADLHSKLPDINEWTLRDSLAKLMVAGEVKRFGLARATRFAKARHEFHNFVTRPKGREVNG